MSIQPLADRVVVKVSEAKAVTKGGLMLPETAQEKPQEGTVIAIGTGVLLENGTVVSLDVAVGDHILFGKYAGVPITTADGEELQIIKQEDILAVVK